MQKGFHVVDEIFTKDTKIPREIVSQNGVQCTTLYFRSVCSDGMKSWGGAP